MLDWDEAFVGPPEMELAWAAWEWGDGLWADDLGDVLEFADRYRAAGGRTSPLTELELFQLVRVRLRAEVRAASAIAIKLLELWKLVGGRASAGSNQALPAAGSCGYCRPPGRRTCSGNCRISCAASSATAFMMSEVIRRGRISRACSPAS